MDFRRLRPVSWSKPQVVLDLSAVLRPLVRRPRVTVLAVGTLALGLATSTAVFTYVNAYTRPFPGADPSGLYQIYLVGEDGRLGAVSWPDYQDLAEGPGADVELSGLLRPFVAASVRHAELTEVAFGQGVTGRWFSALRIEMAVGRGLTPDDDRAGAEPAVVISHAWWLRRFGGDPEVAGRTLLLNGEPYTIVGVTGREFLGSTSGSRPQFWLPSEQYRRVYWARSDRAEDREAGAVSPYVRLAGTSTGEVEQSLSAFAAGLDRQIPLADRERRFVLRPATWISPTVRASEAPTTRIMVGAAAGLLLLACANVANLLLLAGVRRSREMAVRGALGATPGRLARQLTLESLVLSVLAGALAVLAADPLGDRLSSYFARPGVWGASVPREIDVDPSVLLFALLVAVVTGVVTSVAPALGAATSTPAEGLREPGSRSLRHRGRSPWLRLGTREVLVSVQIALSVVLLFVAGLVLRTLDSARRVDAGFDTRTTVASYVSTSSMGVPVEDRHAFFGELIRRFEELPWVVSATVAQNAPLSGHPTADLRAERSDGAAVRATLARVWPGYFGVVGQTLLRGRAFGMRDTVGAPGVVIVNESLARRIAPEADAVGSRLWRPGGDDGTEVGYEVIGVVADTRQASLLDDPPPVAFFSLVQEYSPPGNAFLLSVRGSPSASVESIERELRAVDPRLAIVNVLPYADVERGFLYVQRMNAELFSLIAVVALLLASAGVFGVVALAVARRRREIGIRVAVGGGRGDIVRLVVATISVPFGLGLTVGLGGAFLVSGVVEGLVWGIEPTDPTALAAGALVLLGAVALAVLLPVRRALAVDPVASLRAE